MGFRVSLKGPMLPTNLSKSWRIQAARRFAKVLTGSVYTYIGIAGIKLAENRERRIKWLYDSKKQLMTFPQEVRTQVVYALSEAQLGRKADYSKPMTGLGAGVFEIVADHDGDTYRSVYAVKLGEEIYVLHSFQKKSTIGIKTPKPDLDLIKTRLSRLKQHVAEAKKAEKRKKK